MITELSEMLQLSDHTEILRNVNLPFQRTKEEGVTIQQISPTPCINQTCAAKNS